MNKHSCLPSSFRDPSGFVFSQNGVLYRQINSVYTDNFYHLMISRPYEDLTTSGLMVHHEGAASAPTNDFAAYKVIIPEKIPFISYPYEWCFSQFKNAALATLKIQQKALEFGMRICFIKAVNSSACAVMLLDCCEFVNSIRHKGHH